MSKKLFVVSGPSGAGIGEVLAAVFARRQDVTAVTPVTARKMKPGEENGVGYFFYDLEGWSALKESGDLLETTEFAGNDYGTSRALVEAALAQGKHVVLSLSVERAAQIKAHMPEAVCVYMEPSYPVLEARYRAKARSEIEVSVRMEEARRQRGLADFCDARIPTDDLDAAVSALCTLLDQET